MNTWVTHDGAVINYLCDGDIRLAGMREGERYYVSRKGKYVYYDERSAPNVAPAWQYRMVILDGKPCLVTKEANSGRERMS